MTNWILWPALSIFLLFVPRPSQKKHNNHRSQRDCQFYWNAQIWRWTSLLSATVFAHVTSLPSTHCRLFLISRDDTLTMEAWRLKKELWMACKPVFAASHHFAESRIRIQIWIPFKVIRRTQIRIKVKRVIRIRIKVSRIRIYLVTVIVNKHCTMYMDTKKRYIKKYTPLPQTLTCLLKSPTISTIM